MSGSGMRNTRKGGGLDVGLYITQNYSVKIDSVCTFLTGFEIDTMCNYKKGYIYWEWDEAQDFSVGKICLLVHREDLQDDIIIY